jgi:hypothetical protein
LHVQTPPASRVPLRWSPWLLLWLFLAPFIVKTFADPDLWGHVRFGLDALKHPGEIPVDSYSFTRDLPWTNHEWLSELTMGAAYRAAGSFGLVVLKSILVSAVLAIVLSSFSGALPLASAALLVVVAWGTAPQTLTLRPQLWTLVGLVVLCRLLITTPRAWWLVALPSLFALWVNLHGGWIVGAGLLAVWTAYHLYRADAPRLLVAAVALLSGLATLINPYGWGMWRFLAATVRVSRPIQEWQPLSARPAGMWIPYILVFAVVALCAASKDRPPMDRLAMIALLALAALRVSRLAPLWVAVAVVLISPTVIAWSRAVPAYWWTLHAPSRAAAMLTVIPIVCVALFSAREVVGMSECVPIVGDWIPDTVASRALSDGAATGTIVTWFAWGEYALWHLSPALRVSLDGRRETIYSDSVLEQHDALYEGTAEGVAYLQRLDPTYVWVPASSSRLRDWLGTHGYRIDVQTNRSFVAVRSDRPTLRLPNVPASSCFPGS